MLGVTYGDSERVSCVRVDAVEAGNSILTIIATCRFSACPTPTTVFLIRFAAYSATGKPLSANVARATPRACPSFRADCGSRLMNVSSTAASCGPSRSMSPASKRWIVARRSGSEAAAVGLDRAAANEAQPRPGRLDHAPSGRTQAGIDAENANCADGHDER